MELSYKALAASGTSRGTGEFDDPQVEQVFSLSKLAKTRSELRSTLLFCAAFYVAFSITDVGVLGFSRTALLLLGVRLCVAVSALFSCYLIWKRPDSVATAHLAACTTELTGMLAFLAIVWFRPAEAAWHAMSMAMMLIVVYLYIPNRLRYSLAIAWLATVLFTVLVVVMGTLQRFEILTMSMILLLANAFGFAAAKRYQILWREEYRVQAVFEKLSLHDHLTGCHNRHYLQHEHLATELARARRYGLPLTVVLCDIDHFKGVNDTHGHEGGDKVLIAFSNLLRAMTREPIDSVIRYGGEEFLLVLPETDLHGGLLLAERLRVAFAAAVTPHAEASISVTASFGVAAVDFTQPQDQVVLRELISLADHALYRAKDAGRNRVEAASGRPPAPQAAA
jgi:diguanylate cyclase (GGDEF)-like protein